MDYTVIQSIMRLSKLKEDMQRFNLGEIDTTKIITDFSFKAPTVSPVSLGQQIGAAREAYEKGSGSSEPFENSGTVEATVTVPVQLMVDGDVFVEKTITAIADLTYRNNGKPLW